MTQTMTGLGWTAGAALASFAAAYWIVWARARKERVGAPTVRASLRLSGRMANIILALMLAAYAVTFGGMSLLRHEALHSGGYDLGIFAQALWNSLSGRLLENSIMLDSPSLLGHHWSPLLLGLAPVYAVWSDPRALLVVQTLALALGAVPLYWYARRELGTGLALVVAALYLLYPALQYVNLFEFHEIALVTPLLALALFFLFRKRTGPFLICVGLTLLLKEEMAFVAFGLGVYLAVVQRRRVLGLALAATSVVWGYAVIAYVIPAFHGGAGGYFFAERYSYLGGSVGEIAQNALASPGRVIGQLATWPRLEFLLQLLVPLSFLPLLGSGALALGLPTLGYLLSANYPNQYSIEFQYTAPLIPIFLFALVGGVKRALAARPLAGLPTPSRAYMLAVPLLTAAVLSYVWQGPGPLSARFDPETYTVTGHTRTAYELMVLIPPEAAVLADSNFVPHLASRRTVYQAGIVPDLRAVDYILVDESLPVHQSEQAVWQDILPSPFFETVAARDGYLLKRRSEAPPKIAREIRFEDGITLSGYSVEGSAARGDSAHVAIVWRAEAAVTDRLTAFVHLRDAAGNLWAQDDREPGNGWFRTDRWRAGDVTPDGYILSLPSYMPPGDYTMTAGLYTTDKSRTLRTLDPAEVLVGERVLGTLDVTPAQSPLTFVEPDIAWPREVEVGPVALEGTTGLPATVESGETMGLGVYWHTLSTPPRPLQMTLGLFDAQGRPVTDAASTVVTPFPTTQWVPGAYLLQWHRLPIPEELQAGSYQVALLVGDGKGSRRQIPLGQVQVRAVEHVYTIPPIPHPLVRDFGASFELLGYGLQRAGLRIELSLYWKSLAPTTTSYTVFVHALDAEGKVVAQEDSVPRDGEYPTARWKTGEIVQDTYTLELPATGEATLLEIGWYDARTNQRVKRADGSDHVLVPLTPGG